MDFTEIHHRQHQDRFGDWHPVSNRKQIGADRLANAVGVAELYGVPAIVRGLRHGGHVRHRQFAPRVCRRVIAPGLAAVTDYLYQRTALLPRIKLAEPRSAIGKSTVERCASARSSVTGDW